MRPAEFEKKISHLSQEEIVSNTLSVIGYLLIEKGIATREEFQNKFLWVMEQRAKPKPQKTYRTIKNPPKMTSKSVLAKKGITSKMIEEKIREIRPKHKKEKVTKDEL